jgi:hypothetical protein
MILIRPLSNQDIEAVANVAQALSEWFDENARSRAIPLDCRYQDGFVAEDKWLVLGFITLYVAEGQVNIGWMGVLPN